MGQRAKSMEHGANLKSFFVNGVFFSISQNSIRNLNSMLFALCSLPFARRSNGRGRDARQHLFSSPTTMQRHFLLRTTHFELLNQQR